LSGEEPSCGAAVTELDDVSNAETATAMQCPAVTGEPNVRVRLVPTSSAGVAVWTMAMAGHRPRPVALRLVSSESDF
jgi:hypothetical protein